MLLLNKADHKYLHKYIADELTKKGNTTVQTILEVYAPGFTELSNKLNMLFSRIEDIINSGETEEIKLLKASILKKEILELLGNYFIDEMLIQSDF